MDDSEFDKHYLDWTLGETVRKIRMFRDLDLPKIRGTLSRGYAHSSEDDFHSAIGFLERSIKDRYETFRILRDNEECDYISIRVFIFRLHKRWRFPL